MAQETRLTALRLLVRAGPEGLPAGEIARRLAVPPPTLSFHLRALLHAGLVRSTRDGRSLFYAADFARLRGLVDFLSESCCQPTRAAQGGRRRPA
jgi:DNA-binding transcriptional ArsR family regulator